MLRFACQFAEFGGWIFQDAGDLTCAMQWTNRALDYALELGDERVIAYTLMRKAMIATEGGTPARVWASPMLPSRQGFTDADGSGLSSCGSDPIRTRSWVRSSLRPGTLMKRLPKPSLVKIRMKRTGRLIARRLTLRWKPGRPGYSSGIRRPRSRSWRRAASEWADHTEVRDYALCVSRLALAYAAAGDVEQACAAADEVVALAQGLGSRRVVGQLRPALPWAGEVATGSCRGWRAREAEDACRFV